MKILEIDKETYKVYGDGLVIHGKLEPAVYTVQFGEMTGFYLKKHAPLTVTEKLYGQHEAKISKLVRSYDQFERPMGVIFSGAKGIGKSIAARMLCEQMMAKGLPVIMVEQNIPGITSFIDSIQQECVVLFDEFEKNFKLYGRNDSDDDSNDNQQDRLLSLFDGTSSNVKRLYIITCNNVTELSTFLVNRPGRFHYHIRWHYPTMAEVEEYLKDKVDEKYHDRIPAVLDFSHKVQLNFDCLRAIAFELNLGEHFEDVIDDLNIKNVENYDCDIHLQLKDGRTFIVQGETIDLFQNKKTSRRLYAATLDNGHRDVVYVRFVPANITLLNGVMHLDPKTTELILDSYDSEDKDITNMFHKAWVDMKFQDDGYSFGLKKVV